MLLSNSDKIMSFLKPTDVVLDIGGWAHPFRRANWGMDMGDFDSRGAYNRTFARNNPLPPIGGDVEFFTRDTWIQRDICEKTPYPFKDKQLDFVVCSHTLEDIRDPLWVCSEMIRIAKCGYVETPSRMWETCRGRESRDTAGLSHHRWLIELRNGELTFLQKLHMIHRMEYSFPSWYASTMTDEQSNVVLFWDDEFRYSELVLHGDAQNEEMLSFAQANLSRPSWQLRANAFRRLWADRWTRRVSTPLQLAARGAR